MSPVYFEVTSQASALVMKNNSAGRNGGALIAFGSQAILNVPDTFSITADSNSANLDGGGFNFMYGASMTVSDSCSPRDCPISMRGNGVCDPLCLTKACNWYFI